MRINRLPAIQIYKITTKINNLTVYSNSSIEIITTYHAVLMYNKMHYYYPGDFPITSSSSTFFIIIYTRPIITVYY